MAAKKELLGFQNFMREQGIVGLAIGVIIGVAVKDTVDALVANIINPFIALFLPADRLADATFTIGESVFGWGAFVSAAINLLIVAAVVYFFINKSGLQSLDKKKD